MSLGAAELAVVWHDTECGSYSADLATWRALAAERPGPVLDIGSGTGRVALDLAARGHQVTALDSDPDLLRALADRAAERSLPATTATGDARSFRLDRSFALAIAPMQVTQLLGGHEGRAGLLAAARDHLEPHGLLALALADPFEEIPAETALPPLPDVREEAGWVFSSTPIKLRAEATAVAIDRVRQSVSPEGSLTEEALTIRLDHVTTHELEAEGAEAGFSVLPVRRVAPTDEHVGSAIVVLEAP